MQKHLNPAVLGVKQQQWKFSLVPVGVIEILRQVLCNSTVPCGICTKKIKYNPLSEEV